jgi:hypothetical protein
MKWRHSLLSWLALCTLALGGCASTGQLPGEPALPPIRAGTIARLIVDGPNAYIDGQPVRSGSYVVDGDTVSTGPGTSAKLILNEGGEIQLDENTDPLFKQGACLLLKIFHGRVAFQNMKCQEFEDGLNMAGVARSFVHIESLENESRVTVIEGEVEMRSPSQATLGRNAEYVATADGAVQVLQLTPEEANARLAWTRKYFGPKAARQSDGLSPTEAGAIGAGIGVFLDIFGRGRHGPPPRDSPQRPQTQPEVQPQPQRQPQPQPPPQPQRQPQPQPPPISQTDTPETWRQDYSSTTISNPPYIMRLPSKGMFSGFMNSAMRGSCMTLSLTSSRLAREG